MFGATFPGGFAGQAASVGDGGSFLTALDHFISSAAASVGAGSVEAAGVATARGSAGGVDPSGWPELAPAAGQQAAGVTAKPPLLPIRNAPATVGDLVASAAPPKGFQELLLWVGADPASPLEDFCLIPETDFMDALGGLEVDEIS